MILLIDADVLCHKFAFINEYEIEWGDDVKSKQTNKRKAIADFAAYVDHLKSVSNCKEAILVLSGANNFRYTVLPTYKHDRGEKPELVEFLKQHVRDYWRYEEWPTLEGDDVLGILMTKYPDQYVCCTIDKDLKQIPGTHFHMTNEEFFYVEPDDGLAFFHTQILTGDTTDGYGGCPGVGKQGAAEFLAAPFTWGCFYKAVTRGPNKGMLKPVWTKTPTDDIWKGIVSHYEKAGLTEADALQQARVAKILTAQDYDFEKQEVILWTPKR